MSFEDGLDKVLAEREQTIWGGLILNVNTLVSNAISVPEGQYRVLLKDSDTCKLISTNEAKAAQSYEVLKPTLAGFYNPEVHRRVVLAPTGKFIAEDAKPDISNRLRRLYERRGECPVCKKPNTKECNECTCKKIDEAVNHRTCPGCNSNNATYVPCPPNTRGINSIECPDCGKRYRARG